MSCLEPCPEIIPTIILGEGKTIGISLTNKSTGLPVDLTGVSALTALLQNVALFSPPVLVVGLTPNTNGSQTSVVSAPGGRFNLILNALDTINLALSGVNLSGQPAYSNLEIRFTLGGIPTTVQFPNSISVLPKLFPSV